MQLQPCATHYNIQYQIRIVQSKLDISNSDISNSAKLKASI